MEPETFLKYDKEEKERLVLLEIPTDGIRAVDVPFRISKAIINYEQMVVFEKMQTEVQTIIQRLLDAGDIRIGKKLLLYRVKDIYEYFINYVENEFDQVVDFSVEPTMGGRYYSCDVYPSKLEAYNEALSYIEENLVVTDNNIEGIKAAREKTVGCLNRVRSLIEKEN